MIPNFKNYICIFLLSSCTVVAETIPNGSLDLFGLKGDSFNGTESRNGHIFGLFLTEEAAFFYKNNGYEWSIKHENSEEELSSISYQSNKIQLISSEMLPLSRSLIIGENIQSGSYDVVLNIYFQGKVNDEEFFLKRFKRKILIDN